MTTITRFTKEQLIAKAQEQIEFIRRTQVTGAGREHVDMCGALFEIALASLTAEPVYQYQSGIYNEDSGETEWYWDDCDRGFTAVCRRPPSHCLRRSAGSSGA